MKTRSKQISSVLSRRIEQTRKPQLEEMNRMYFSSGISGTLESMDMTSAKEKIFIPEGYKKIIFKDARPNRAMMTFLTCGISIMNNGFKLDTVFASVFSNRSTEIPLSASNCSAEIFLQVGDSYGGKVSWELRK